MWSKQTHWVSRVLGVVRRMMSPGHHTPMFVLETRIFRVVGVRDGDCGKLVQRVHQSLNPLGRHYWGGHGREKKTGRGWGSVGGGQTKCQNDDLLCFFFFYASKNSPAIKTNATDSFFFAVMSDVYYVIVTVIFGVFVLVMAVWIWRYMRASNPLELTHEELSDDQKAMIYQFCGEMRRAREAREQSPPTASTSPTRAVASMDGGRRAKRGSSQRARVKSG